MFLMELADKHFPKTSVVFCPGRVEKSLGIIMRYAADDH